MSGRGSNKRKLDHEVLVRMDAKTYERVTGLAADAGIKSAEYLRRRIEMPDDDETGSSSRRGLSVDDREVLGGRACTLCARLALRAISRPIVFCHLKCRVI